MGGDIYITQGDLTQLAAHAVVFSTSPEMRGTGLLQSAFAAQVPGFSERFAKLRRDHGGKATTGDAYWLPLGEPLRRGAVIVVSTGQGPEGGAAAVRNAIKKACEELGPPAKNGRWLIALPAFRFGMGGDRNRRLESARLQLEAARETLRTCDDADAVFVTYHPDDYQIFLTARLALREASPAEWGESEWPEIAPELVEAVAKRECVFFLGSGVSAGAQLPGWNALAHQLADALHVPDSDRSENIDYYLDLAQWYLESDAEEQRPLARIVQDTFGNTQGRAEPTLVHYQLLGLPVRYVVTTNYDDLIERCFRALRRYPVQVIDQQDIPHTGAREGSFVVKFHGDADHPDSIILSRDQYETFFRKQPAMALLLEGLLLNQTFFFVGYSLRDPDFRQIHHRISTMLEKAQRPAFATTFETTSSYQVAQWKKRALNLLPMEGANTEGKARKLRRFLDRLAELVAGRQQLFLAPDAHADEASFPTPLGALRQQLQKAGECAEAALVALFRQGVPRAEDLEQLEWTLQFLTEHGWRPQGLDAEGRRHTVARLWRQLAELSPAGPARVRRLTQALAHANTYAAAQQLGQQLEQEQPPRRPSHAASTGR